MNNIIEVRTDIIEPHVYLECQMNYKELLRIIGECGGYAFFQQLYKYFGSKSKGFREIKKMEDLLLIGNEKFNNNKYVYLKSNSLMYLKYKDIEVIEDTNVNRLLIKPGLRPILNSVYSLEYYLVHDQKINEEISKSEFKNFIFEGKKVFENNRITNIYLSRISKDEYIQRVETKLKILGDRNAIYLKSFQKNDDFRNSVLNFVWFDFETSTDENPIVRVTRLISRFLNNIGTTGKNNLLNCCNFSLEVVTTSEDRKSNLEKITENAMEVINKKNAQYLNSNVKIKINNVISNILEINFTVLKDIEGYLKLSVKGEGEFNFVNDVTIDRLQELRGHLKEGR